jgi:transcriptional regulator with XRE-family HTH domain
MGIHAAVMRKTTYSLQNQILLVMLRASRRQRQLRQVDVARRLGRDQAMVSKVESGERRLDVIELRAWLAVLGENFAHFVTELDERIEVALPPARGSIWPAGAVEAESTVNRPGFSRHLRASN